MDIIFKKINIGSRTVALYSNTDSGAPVVVYPAFGEPEDLLWQSCHNLISTPFTLAIIGNIRWYDEMTPWAMSPIAKNDPPCTGGADRFIDGLTEILLPAITKELPAAPTCYALAGYSLAGLFALYAAFHTVCFDCIASVSGSLWYPDIVEYVRTHELSPQIKAVYFSLGDKEDRTRSALMKPVRNNTESINQLICRRGIPTVFELNEGNHFNDADKRAAKAIKWLLDCLYK